MNLDIKKLTSYCLDCVKYSGRCGAFNNLNSNNSNIVYSLYSDISEFEASDKKINEIMMSYALNKGTMTLLLGKLFLKGTLNKKTQLYSPLLYTGCMLTREGDIIKLTHDNDFIINVGLIACLLDKDTDIIEASIEQLLNIEEPEKIDFKSVLTGIIPDMKEVEIIDKSAVILAKMPESTAGLIAELKEIVKLCNNNKQDVL